MIANISGYTVVYFSITTNIGPPVQVGDKLVFLVAHSRPEVSDLCICLLGPPERGGGEERGEEKEGIKEREREIDTRGMRA